MVKKQAASSPRLARIMPYILIVCGFIGLIASFIITEDKLKLAQNPAFRPNCDLNPILSCGSVMATPQGSLFGFPNPWIGLAAYSVLITIGMAMLAGGKFKRWFWVGLEVGAILGLAFVHWLFFQSVYRINALCLYCIVIWIVTITTFWYTTIYNLKEGHIILPKALSGVGPFLRRHHLDLLLLWFLIIVLLTLTHFWYYYGPALSRNF